MALGKEKNIARSALFHWLHPLHLIISILQTDSRTSTNLTSLQGEGEVLMRDPSCQRARERGWEWVKGGARERGVRDGNGLRVGLERGELEMGMG